MSTAKETFKEKDIWDMMQDYKDFPKQLAELGVLQARGVEIPCETCHGLGTRAYRSTATWHGGIGGQMVTGDVCDKCWGTGDKYQKGANLKTLYSELERLQRRVKEGQQ